MLYFDTETTDLIRNAALHLDKQPHIIEIGMLREPNIKGRPSQFQVCLNVPVPLKSIITKITGLTDEDLADCDKFADIYEDLADFVRGEDTMIAHNMPFDLGMLNFELRRAGKDKEFPMPENRIDTVQLARRFYGGSFIKLQVLHDDLCLPKDDKRQTHRAIDDCIMLQQVYHALMVKGNGN